MNPGGVGKLWAYELRRPDGTVLWSAQYPVGRGPYFAPNDPIWDIVGPIEAWSREGEGPWTYCGPWPR